MIERLYTQSLRPDDRPLRVAVLLDSFEVIPQFGVVLDQLLAAPFVDLCLLVMHDAEPVVTPDPPGWSAILPRKLRNLVRSDVRPRALFTLYEAFDRRMNPAAAAATNPINYSEQLSGIPRLSVRPITKRFVHRFPPEAIAELRRQDLDVLLRFGFNILRGEILECARYGVWSYHHGDNDQYRGGPPHFWEMVERNPVSGVMLQVLTEELDGGRVLTKALAPTASFTSWVQNRVAPYAAGNAFVLRKLWELHSYGPDHLEQTTVPAEPYRGLQKIYRHPDNAAMLRFLPRLGTVARNRLWGSDDIARWRIAIRRPPAAFSEKFDARGFNWLEPPPGHFHADPFPWRVKDQDWIFFEDYWGGRGRLAAAPVNDNDTLGEVHTVLDRPYHLSYPFLWEQDGALFMIPETGSNRTVELYRCTRFPDQWKLERVMFEGPAMDTTILAHEGRLWFFVSLIDRPAPAQLFLFSARSLFDEWTYHPANPISLDIRTSRCGGAFFTHQGRPVRVAQDGSRRYGYALRFQQVERLNEREYRERVLSELMPDTMDSHLLGVHTYNRSATLELLDGQRREPKSRLS